MIYVALAAIAVLAIAVVTFAGVLRSMSRAHARREDLLVNQLCNLAGTPWQQPPAANANGWTTADDGREPTYALFTTNPEQEV